MGGHRWEDMRKSRVALEAIRKAIHWNTANGTTLPVYINKHVNVSAPPCGTAAVFPQTYISSTRIQVSIQKPDTVGESSRAEAKYGAIKCPALSFGGSNSYSNRRCYGEHQATLLSCPGLCDALIILWDHIDLSLDRAWINCQRKRKGNMAHPPSILCYVPQQKLCNNKIKHFHAERCVWLTEIPSQPSESLSVSPSAQLGMWILIVENAI